jgi:hypothetical protein
VANEYVDELLQNVHGFVGENSLNEIDIPGIEAGFSKEVGYFTQNRPNNRFAYCRL